MSDLAWNEIIRGVDLLAVCRELFHVEQGISTPDGSLVRCFLAGHDDRRPSLHLRYKHRPNADHRYYCFGCRKQGDAAQLLQDAGMAASFPEAIKILVESHLAGVVAAPLREMPHVGGGESKTYLREERQEAVYVYQDASGHPLLQVERIVGINEDGERDKRFRQSHRWEHGCCPTCSRAYRKLVERGEENHWTTGRLLSECARRGYVLLPNNEGVGAHPGEFRIGGLPRELLVPYRLPELLQESGAVFFVEGEKKTDAVRDMLGFTTTSAPGGATSAMPQAWVEYFRKARTVVIVPDCDKPGRILCAQPRAKQLRESGIRAEVLDIAPTRDDGYDIYDWLMERRAEGLSQDGMRQALRDLRIEQMTRTT